MSRCPVFAGLTLVAFLVATPETRAQAVELTAFGGPGFGGELLEIPGFEVREYYTPVVISGAAICGGYGCVIGYTGTGTFSGDISAGVIVSFWEAPPRTSTNAVS
jgi:hypothetical protein